MTGAGLPSTVTEMSEIGPGGTAKRLFWSVAIVCVSCAGPHLPGAMSESLSPLQEEHPVAVVVPAPDHHMTMLQRGFELIPNPDARLYSLASKIVRSKGAAVSDYDEVYFYESAEEYQVELMINFLRRMRSVPIVLPENLYIRISKPDMTVTEITGCEGLC